MGCKLEFEKVTKEFCHIKPKRVCETKTHEYKVVTGHEKGDCKEIEVCKPFHHRRMRSPHGFLHDHPYHECEKEKKEVCKVVPTVEEKTEEFDVCHIELEKVCEEKEVEVAKHVCEEDEDSDAESDGVEAVRKRRGRKGRKGKKGGKGGREDERAKEESAAKGKEMEKGQRIKT